MQGNLGDAQVLVRASGSRMLVVHSSTRHGSCNCTRAYLCLLLRVV